MHILSLLFAMIKNVFLCNYKEDRSCSLFDYYERNKKYQVQIFIFQHWTFTENIWVFCIFKVKKTMQNITIWKIKLNNEKYWECNI